MVGFGITFWMSRAPGMAMSYYSSIRTSLLTAAPQSMIESSLRNSLRASGIASTLTIWKTRVS